MDATKLNSFLECSLCLDVFVDPRNLPCGHTFCLKCIEYFVGKNASKQLLCAICRMEWSVPDNGLQGLMKNFALNSFVKPIGQQLHSGTNCGLIDDGDEHGAAEYFCIDCWDPLCADCNKMHKKSKLTQSHNIKKMVDVTEADIRKHEQSKEVNCSKHKEKILEFYCNECKSALCYVCCVNTHLQHKCVELSKVDEKFIEQIKHEIEKGKALENSYNIQLATVEQITRKFEDLCTQKLNTLQLNTSDIQNNFTLVMEKIKENESHAENGLSKVKADETTRLRNIVKDIKEKLRVQHELNLANEQYLPPFSSVIHRVEACAKLSEKNTEDTRSNIPLEKVKLPSISIWKWHINYNGVIKLKNSVLILELISNLITSLSVYNNKILACTSGGKEVYVYSTNGVKLSTFKVSMKNLLSATWISDCQVICTSDNRENPIIMSELESTLIELSKFKYCVDIHSSVHKPKVIYIADWMRGVYKSVDIGKTWFHVCPLPSKCFLRQVIPIITNDNKKQVFWTQTWKSLDSRHCLQECVVNQQGLAKWRDIDLSMQSGKTIQLEWRSTMVYDENDVIFLSCPTDHAVYAFSVKSGKLVQSLSITEGLHEPSGLAIDNTAKLLYVGNKYGDIKIFNFENISSIDIRVEKEYLVTEDIMNEITN